MAQQLHQADKAKNETERVAKDARDQLNKGVEQAKQQGREMAEQAKEQAAGVVENQKHSAAEQLDGVAEALRHAADDFSEEQRWLAQGTQQTAQRVDNLARTLRDNDTGELLRRVERYAREQPTVVLGGAALVGFIAARFLKSSARGDQQTRDHLPEQPPPASGAAQRAPSASANRSSAGV